MCFGLCQMANRFQDSPSGPGLARSTCEAGWADPLEHTTRSQAAQRPRDSGSPKPQLCSPGRQQEFRQEISFCGHKTKGKKTTRGRRRKKRSYFSLKFPKYQVP